MKPVRAHDGDCRRRVPISSQTGARARNLEDFPRQEVRPALTVGRGEHVSVPILRALVRAHTIGPLENDGPIPTLVSTHPFGFDIELQRGPLLEFGQRVILMNKCIDFLDKLSGR